MVNEKIKILPTPDEVTKVLFCTFCERCEPGEKECINPERIDDPDRIMNAYCPVFIAIQNLCPDNQFVMRVAGRYYPCPKCQRIGMMPPTSTFDAPVQPVLVCESCNSPLWKDQHGILVDKLEDINKTFDVILVEEDK